MQKRPEFGTPDLPRILLDSDNLFVPDALFDTVRTDIATRVIISTREVLRRMWCAGEIATGVADTVHVVTVRRDGYRRAEARGGGSHPGFFRSVLAQDQGSIPAAPEVRQAAAQALGRVAQEGDRQACDALISRMQEDDH